MQDSKRSQMDGKTLNILSFHSVLRISLKKVSQPEPIGLNIASWSATPHTSHCRPDGLRRSGREQ